MPDHPGCRRNGCHRGVLGRVGPPMERGRGSWSCGEQLRIRLLDLPDPPEDRPEVRGRAEVQALPGLRGVVPLGDEALVGGVEVHSSGYASSLRAWARPMQKPIAANARMSSAIGVFAGHADGVRTPSPWRRAMATIRKAVP